MSPSTSTPHRPPSLLRQAGGRLRHVAGCRDCRHHYVVARGRGLRPDLSPAL